MIKLLTSLLPFAWQLVKLLKSNPKPNKPKADAVLRDMRKLDHTQN
jgi:hypothetical protein